MPVDWNTTIRGNVEFDPEEQFPLPAEAQTIFHEFQNAGNKTDAFDKWGLGFSALQVILKTGHRRVL